MLLYHATAGRACIIVTEIFSEKETVIIAMWKMLNPIVGDLKNTALDYVNIPCLQNRNSHHGGLDSAYC